jgi:hypothetical protein
MSESVMSSGIMVPLNHKLTYEERQKIDEDLFHSGSNVHINYDGTLAYTDDGGEEYGISFGEMPEIGKNSFDCLTEYNVHVIMEQAKPYRCYWYNGSDSDMNMLTLEKFLNSTK